MRQNLSQDLPVDYPWLTLTKTPTLEKGWGLCEGQKILTSTLTLLTPTPTPWKGNKPLHITTYLGTSLLNYIEIYTPHQHHTCILITSKLLDQWPMTWTISKNLQYVSHILPPLISREKLSPAWHSSLFWDLFPTASSRHYKIWSVNVPEAFKFERLAMFGGNPKELGQCDLCSYQERTKAPTQMMSYYYI